MVLGIIRIVVHRAPHLPLNTHRPQGKTVAAAAGMASVESVYELGCVLYHKGNNVHSGHYIAEVGLGCTREPWNVLDLAAVGRIAVLLGIREPTRSQFCQV